MENPSWKDSLGCVIFFIVVIVSLYHTVKFLQNYGEENKRSHSSEAELADKVRVATISFHRPMLSEEKLPEMGSFRTRNPVNPPSVVGITQNQPAEAMVDRSDEIRKKNEREAEEARQAQIDSYYRMKGEPSFGQDPIETSFISINAGIPPEKEDDY